MKPSTQKPPFARGNGNKCKRFVFTQAACLLTAICACSISLAQPPPASVQNVTDDYWGVKVVDPFRWMEDGQSNQMRLWLKGQAVYADNYLQKMPLRAPILKRLQELSAARTAVGRVKRVGDRLIYVRRAAGESQGKVVTRLVWGGQEKTLIDLDQRSASEGKTYQVRQMIPSPDGQCLAYEIFAGGSENGEINVLEIATGRDLGERIYPDAQPLSWLPDSKGFTYSRSEEQPANARPEQREEKKRVRLHRLGEAVGKDRAIFGYGVNAQLRFPVLNDYAVTVPAGSPYAIAWVNPGVTTNYELYFAPIAALSRDTEIPWSKIGGLEDEVFASYYQELAISMHREDLYLATTKNTPLGKVIRLDLNKPDLAAAESIFSSSTEIVHNLRAAKDALYVLTIDGGAYKLRRIDYRSKKMQVIDIPSGGSVFDMNADQLTEGLIFGTDSWVKPESYWRYNPLTGRLEDTGLTGSNPCDASHIEIVHTKAESHDGTLVPMVIVHKKGLPLDGTHPTLLDGYGSFGINHLEPMFQSSRLAWLERGGVLALAGVRGGGEYGESWRLGGFQQTKPNTWKDFIACAQYLIGKQYTSPAHLAGRGVSGGGVLINNALVERPDLFAAAVVSVGLSNTLRFETTANGASVVAEYGSVKTEEGFRGLLAMDAYHKVKPGIGYPAVLFTHGANDKRVEPWLSAKMAARLQAASTSGHPILLRINYDGGHSGGSNVQQANELQADIFAFLFQQLKP